MGYPNTIQEINSKLSLSGGTLTGAITIPSGTVNGNLSCGGLYSCRAYDDNSITLGIGNAWNDAPSISLYSPTHSTMAGKFAIRAIDNTGTRAELVGDPNGYLSWKNKLIESVDSSYKGTANGDYSWTRYTNGLQIVWGRNNHAGTSTQINFPVAFINAHYGIQLCTDWSGDTISAINTVCWVGTMHTTYFKMYRNYTSELYWNFIAIGYWK